MTISDNFFLDVQFVEEILKRPTSEHVHRLSSTKVTETFQFHELNYDRLKDFSSRGNLVEVQVKSGHEYVARFSADSTSVFTYRGQTGSFEAVARDEEAGQKAITSGRFIDFATAINDAYIVMALTLRAPPNGPSFVWTENDLFRMPISWVALAQLFASCRQLLVLDAGNAIVTTESLAIFGPEITASNQLKTPDTWKFSDTTLAFPSHYNPTKAVGLPLVTEALRKLANGVIWLRIATSGDVLSSGIPLGSVNLTFVDNPPSDFEIDWRSLPSAENDATKSVELWKWLEVEDLAAKLESARQAASYIIRSASDLSGAAAIVLRQARFIHDQSRRNTVAAIVDAQNDARAATQSTAHNAAAEARESARSTADRTVAAVIASLAVMITYQNEILSRSASFFVLVAVAVGVVAAALHAEWFEFPATRSALDATLAELRTTHRQILQTEDVDEIESGAVVLDAKSTISNACTVSRVALGVATLSVLGGILFVSLIPPNENDKPEPPPASTTTQP